MLYAKIFDRNPPTCEIRRGGHLPEVPRRALLLEADLLAVLDAAGCLGVGLHHVVQVVLLVVALYVRVVVVVVVVVEGAVVVVVVTAGSLVGFTPSGRRRRLHSLLLSGGGQSLLLLLFVGQSRPDGQLPLDTGAGVGAVQGAVAAVSVQTVPTNWNSENISIIARSVTHSMLFPTLRIITDIDITFTELRTVLVFPVNNNR